ncbi:MAG: helix-turn-helix domain-containing protein [Anaerovoracaceae bacterium]|jgi:transcriptional regulator with XRE-family HTH domain
MDVTNVISENVKALRLRKELTLDAAAKITGVSRSMLAQIEKGDVNPTISVLWKIANGYKVSFSSLMEHEAEGVSIIRAADIEPLSEDGGKYLNYPAFSFSDKTMFETYRIVIKPGGTLAAQPHIKGAEEYITVFAGKVEITVGEEKFKLGRGDSIRFAADIPHGYSNAGRSGAELSMVIFYNK